MIDPELKKQIENTPLNPGEKEELILSFENSEASYQKELAKEAESHQELLPYLYINLAAKKYAVAKNDPEAFKSVANNAKDFLEEFEKDEK